MIRHARAGGDVWIDHGELGAVAALLRLLRVPGRLHLFHHNDEARYAQDELAAMGLRGWRLRARVTLAALRQGLGLRAAQRHVFISPIERARHPQRCAMVLPAMGPDCHLVRTAIPPMSREDSLGDFHSGQTVS